ncbi:hypothetical protein FHT36_002369 [Xanthobacter sp. SG618]|uniref:DUF5343 domain-containing protein n=1 Tax=Xanthobacter sp. SG618 TaxID=2587121 RepID=UPI00145CA915|nr:DUF5343 domain-containing protein [Xanthobacter sp. SG618]NMN58467.1 hypothetical protein [Xanthobacter sp. SG618]
MALLNRPTQVYGQLPKFFKAIRDGIAPEKFTQQYLKDLGFGSSNFRVLIPLLKDLGFLTPDGTPTERYRDYLDASRSKKVLADAVRSAYSDIFTITKNPTKNEKDKISGKFKSTFNFSDTQADRSANTFLALVDLADFSDSQPDEPEIKTASPPPSAIQQETHDRSNRIIGLRYDIAIHLPATKDIEVYNAIFKALKEHLLD